MRRISTQSNSSVNRCIMPEYAERGWLPASPFDCFLEWDETMLPISYGHRFLGDTACWTIVIDDKAHSNSQWYPESNNWRLKFNEDMSLHIYYEHIFSADLEFNYVGDDGDDHLMRHASEDIDLAIWEGWDAPYRNCTLDHKYADLLTWYRQHHYMNRKCILACEEGSTDEE
ncbi:hypothetical protein BDN70DRAFT_940190 [Pholiota conissans]|uniref:Uncharacterized protein n=1 Tax=Pholiota conissans TaxID=109636 RepID=A0A9P5YJR0_9AGAR|nr:hypothetical protein BDN70DRAFT_940190 [Pholiota conissans]